MPSVSHTEVFPHSVDQLFRVVSDYENYPRFLSEVKECRIVKSESGRKLVEYKVSLIKTFTYQLWTSENPPSEKGARISWTFAGGDVFKSTSGSWTITKSGNTNESESGAESCSALYQVEAEFGIFVPGPIAKSVLSVNLPTMMASYHKRLRELYGK